MYIRTGCMRLTQWQESAVYVQHYHALLEVTDQWHHVFQSQRLQDNGNLKGDTLTLFNDYSLVGYNEDDLSQKSI